MAFLLTQELDMSHKHVKEGVWWEEHRLWTKPRFNPCSATMNCPTFSKLFNLVCKRVLFDYMTIAK